MNKDRRKTIATIVEDANNVSADLAKLMERIASIKGAAEAVMEEEQEYYDNMPESLQNGEKGQAAEEVISQIEDAINELDGLFGDFEGNDDPLEPFTTPLTEIAES